MEGGEAVADQPRLEGQALLRAELAGPNTSLTAANDLAIRRPLESARVVFIDENEGGSRVRLRAPLSKSR